MGEEIKVEGIKTESAYLIARSNPGSKPKEAKIIGFEIVTPKGQKAHPCFVIRFVDGTINFIPLSEINDFKIASAKQMISAR